jgi:S-adenosylmethionine/arginine decarboxylase-like enzyme
MLAHKHLILKGFITSPTSEADIYHTLLNIVRLVGMKVLSPPNVVKCNEQDNVGYTGAVLLTTSHMVWHDWDRFDGTSNLQFDLYSCADFEPEEVATYLKTCHGLDNYEWRLFDREYSIHQQRVVSAGTGIGH